MCACCLSQKIVGNGGMSYLDCGAIGPHHWLLLIMAADSSEGKFGDRRLAKNEAIFISSHR